MKKALRDTSCRLAILAIVLAWATTANAELYINEVFFNPGGSGNDQTDEYIELRGTPSMSLENHYLLFLENEDTPQHDGAAGTIDIMFDLGAFSLGSNGFMTLRQKYSPYSVAEGTTDLMNDGPDISFGPFSGIQPGYGHAENSTIGATDLVSTGSGFPVPEGSIEGGGFTAMLIYNDGGIAPVVGDDLDVGNDGLDHPHGRENWTILDAIGVHGETGETENGRLYAMVNFGTDPSDNALIPEGATYTGVGYEIEYIGRWGNSTGQTAADWHISNLTDDTGSGSAGVPDWRQSFPGDHPPSDGDATTPAPPQATLESNQGVPYGTKLTDTLGAPNYITGDFNKDGIVNMADYVVWRNTLGQAGLESAHPAADHNHDFLVDSLDYDIWKTSFAGTEPLAGLGVASSASVPEPSTVLCAGLGVVLLGAYRRPRR